MNSPDAERRARGWFIVSVIACAGSVAVASWNTGPWPWLVPISTGCVAFAWFALWREHRRRNSSRSTWPDAEDGS